MATMAGEQAAVERKPIWLLKIILDQCAEENGAAPCTATSACYFTWSTCQDTANYNKSSYTWQFCNRGASLCNVGPYLKSFNHLPTSINQDKFKTERGVMTFKLQEDDALPLANPGKSTSESDSGRFWRNLLARNPNYKNRFAELYRGYEGVSTASFTLYFRGLINDVEFTKYGIDIRAVDMLEKAASTKYPNKISDDNTVQDNPLLVGAGTVTVNDVTEFADATSIEPRQIKIESEIIEYTGKGANTLTGCTRAAYGTTAAEHAQDTAINQELVYAGSGYTSGLPADHIFMDLLCNLAGIDASYIAVEDISLTIDDAGGISDADATIGVSNAALLPFEGVIYIETEMIRYTGVSGNNLTGCIRGLYGTTEAAHADTTAVYPTTFTHQIGAWRQGANFQTKIKNPQQINKFISNLQQAVLCDIWQNEAGKIECRMQAPAIAEDSTVLDHEDMVENTRKVSRNEDTRITRVLVYYDQTEEDPGTDPEKYSGLRVYIDSDAESSDNYDEIKEKVIYCPWIKDSAEADWLTAHYFMRYRAGCPKLQFELELYHDDEEVGNILDITVPEIVNSAGTAEGRLYRVIKKMQKGLNSLFFEVEDTGFGDKQYRVIGPSTLVTDYDASTTAEQNKYGFIADSSEFLGAANDPAHRIY